VVTERELTPTSMPHLSLDALGALMTPPEQRTAEQAKSVAFADRLIEELEAADTIVLAVPMYNFSIPSTLKAWIDHVARAGRTFRYTASGPEGLLKGKKSSRSPGAVASIPATARRGRSISRSLICAASGLPRPHGCQLHPRRRSQGEPGDGRRGHRARPCGGRRDLRGVTRGGVTARPRIARAAS
jgi:hypothetical protein